FFFFSSRRRHTRFSRDWSSDVCSSDLILVSAASALALAVAAGPALAQTPPSDVTALGQTVEGRLESDDWRDGDGYVTDVWRFMRSEERRVGKGRTTPGAGAKVGEREGE